MIDVEALLQAGGKQRVELMRYCVMTVNVEPLFLFVAGEYRLRPTHAGALAIYDVFCDARSAARLSAYELLPPRDLSLPMEIERLRGAMRLLESPAEAGEETDDPAARSVPAGASRALFDALVRGVRADSNGKIRAIASTYDPQLSPEENLPGGKMTQAQRRFVDAVWIPFARPVLAGAGFWQVATIG